MDLRQLQHFVVSVDMGSFSRAAEALYTTQSHISKTIKNLESELDITLLKRTPSGVAPTEDGKRVYEYARKILGAARKISAVRQERDSYTMRISAMPSSEVAYNFARFLDEQPTLCVRYQEGSLEMVLHQVSHRHSSLGLIFVSGYQNQALKNAMKPKKLEFITLAKTRLVMYAGPKNPYYNRESVSWSEMQKLRYVQHKEEEISLIQHVGHVRENLVDYRLLRIAAVVSCDNAMRYLLSETSLANLSCRLFNSAASDPAIRAIELEDCASAVSFGYVKRISDKLCEYDVKFISYLKQKLEKHALK